MSARRRRRPILRWHFYRPAGRIQVTYAYTRSEARANVKRALGIGAHGRMPDEVTLVLAHVH